MCNSTEKLTKYTGYYKSPDNIQNFKIRIRLKEEIVDADYDEDEEKWHNKEFIWQEKYFNKIEREYYSDINNCVTELEHKYHEQIVKEDETFEESIFFNYINQDYCNNEDVEENINRTKLEKLMNSIQDYKKDREEYDFGKSVINAVENKVIPNEIEKMFIGADLGECIEEVWIKNEIILCAINYNKVSKTISIYPDFTTTKPYVLKIQGQSLRYIHYFLEHSSFSIPEDESFKENEILRKISEKKLSLTKQVTGEEFFVPPKNKLLVYLFIDILSAKNFEYDKLFMQYFIDLPENWHCENTENLNGVTSICNSKGEDGVLHYGHNFDIVLEYDIQCLQETRTPKSPCIYFQLISKSSWERYRSEGVAYQSLPISRPGCYLYDLCCYRFDTQGFSGELRRFFIGDAYNYKDVRWIGLPEDQCNTGTFNKFGVNTIGTGEIKFRMNVLHQSQAFLKEFNEDGAQGNLIYEKLNSSSLIRSVNQVLIAFKKARRRMYEVKKHL